ncbi:HmuY family protein [Flavobacterium procerum]|uniref:HmuY family protein n=1 Tax=Flavobacterium procerum TaxID=1455569 RepID=A0ABV6BS02_9FLAO
MKHTHPIFSKWSLLLATALILMASCSNSEDTQEKPLPELAPITVTQSGEYTVKELPGDTLSTMKGKDISDSGGFKPLFYSLEDGRVIPEEYADTDKWDIAFTGIYNSSIWANHGEVIFDNGNKGPGYGSPARGGIYLVIDDAIDAKYYDKTKRRPSQVPISKSLFDEAYNNVKTVPIADNQFLSREYLTLDYFLGSGSGYSFYDFYGSMFPSDPKKAHIVYNLPRTIIIKTAKGNYAKLIIYNTYKGQPNSPTLDDKAPYLTFKYKILKDGTKDFTKI